MANLTKVETNTGIEIYIDNTTGESFASISGYARMANLNKSTIARRLQSVAFSGCKTAEVLTTQGLQSVAFSGCKTAEVLTTQGLQSVRLLPEKLIAQWIVKDNPSVAQDLMLLGGRKFLHTMAGFTHHPANQAPPSLSRKEILAMAMEAEERADKLSVELDIAVETIVKLEPKAELADKFIDANGLTTIADFAKDVANKGLGRNTIYSLLRQKRVLDANNRPYQPFVNRGYFVLKPTATYVAYVNLCQQYTTYLTPKGVQWVMKHLGLCTQCQE